MQCVGKFSIEDCFGMFMCGAKAVILNEHKLNQLNVFPVADKDTGTNLASMMRYIVDNFRLSKSINDLFVQLSNHSLIGSSGNSGLIFSQFLYGLTEHKVEEEECLKSQEFATMINNGYKNAYNSVSSPKQGTILTVMEKLAKSYKEHTSKDIDLISSLEKSINETDLALAGTINQLEILKKYNVVDAGAQGFLYFIKGMLEFIKLDKNKKKDIITTIDVLDGEISSHGHEVRNISEMPNFRYCLEIVIRNKDNKKKLEEIRSYLQENGDSIVIGYANKIEKLHMHTDNPIEIANKISKYSDLIYQKADDMKMQFSIASKSQNNKVLIVDSSCDIPPQYLQDNNIFIIPLQLKINNHTFLDKVTINCSSVLEMNINDIRISTASPPAMHIIRLINFLSYYFKEIIIVTIAKSLSSTFDMIYNQSKRFDKVKISVINSNTTASALGLVVMYTHKLISLNKYSLTEVVKKVNYMTAKTKIIIFVNSLDVITQSGRVSRVSVFFTKFFKIKPLLSLHKNGKPKFLGAAFTERGGWGKIANYLNKVKQTEEIKTLAISYTTDALKANKFKEYLEKKTNLKSIFLTEASCAFMVHAGSDGFAIAYSCVSY